MTTTGEAHSMRNGGLLPAKVRQQIVSDIFSGGVKPMDRLDECTLAARYEVSRTPVREALRMLAAEGLVDYQPNRGCFVIAAGDLLSELAEAAGCLHADCARRTASRLDEDGLRRLQTARSPDAVLDLVRDRAGNAFLARSARDLWTLVKPELPWALGEPVPPAARKATNALRKALCRGMVVEAGEAAAALVASVWPRRERHMV